MVTRQQESGLPWNQASAENHRLGLVLLALLIVFLPAALIIPMIELPEPDPDAVEEIPPQLARLMEEREPDPEPEPAPEPEVAEPDPVEEPPEPEEPTPEPPPEEPPTEPETVEEAREVASQAGLMGMRDELADLRDMADLSDTGIQDDASTGQERARDLGEPDEGTLLAGSGGPGTVARGEAEDAELARRQARELEADAEEAAAPTGTPDERPMANIRETFDQNKAALFSIYNRALREDPLLEGQVLLELLISPEGEVLEVAVVESELDRPELEERIANRVRMFSFGSMDVPERRVQFPVDFLPP